MSVSYVCESPCNILPLPGECLHLLDAESELLVESQHCLHDDPFSAMPTPSKPAILICIKHSAPDKNLCNRVFNSLIFN